MDDLNFGHGTRRWFQRTLLGSLAAIATGCGSIMYPERRGQARRGPLDWKVVGLDGIFLLLFFVPGLIAFAVDWYNGTLWLSSVTPGNDTGKMRAISLGTRKPTIREVAAAVRRETGLDITLAPGSYRTRELQSLDEFDAACQELADA